MGLVVMGRRYSNIMSHPHSIITLFCFIMNLLGKMGGGLFLLEPVYAVPGGGEWSNLIINIDHTSTVM